MGKWGRYKWEISTESGSHNVNKIFWYAKLEYLRGNTKYVENRISLDACIMNRNIKIDANIFIWYIQLS